MTGVKVCGLTEPERVLQAADGGARFLGFVLYAPSPRSLKPKALEALTTLVPGGVLKVGVYVDPEDDWLEATTPFLDIAQLHGHESPGRVREIAERFGVRTMKAIRVAEAADLGSLPAFGEVADLILFDAKPPPDPDAIPGGNGLPFDWRLLEGLRVACPWVLAGGLTPGNVQDAVRLTRAPNVDVSSGIETRPGIKDPARLSAFLAAVRAIGDPA